MGRYFNILFCFKPLLWLKQTYIWSDFLIFILIPLFGFRRGLVILFFMRFDQGQ